MTQTTQQAPGTGDAQVESWLDMHAEYGTAVERLFAVADDANGIGTNYLEAGEGTPVVLVHGSGPGVSAYANWRLTIPDLAGEHRVLHRLRHGDRLLRAGNGGVHQHAVGPELHGQRRVPDGFGLGE